MDAIKARRSIRRYKLRDIGREDIDRIIGAGLLAPSAKNRQPWKYIVYMGSSKERLLDEMEKGLIRERDEKPLLPGSRDGLADAFHTLGIMREAPVCIVILNTNGGSPFESTNADGRITEICDTLSIGASVQNILLRAAEMGYGTLWIANTCFAYAELTACIGTDSQLVGAIALGHPAEQPMARRRKAMELVVEYRQ